MWRAGRRCRGVAGYAEAVAPACGRCGSDECMQSAGAAAHPVAAAAACQQLPHMDTPLTHHPRRTKSKWRRPSPKQKPNNSACPPARRPHLEDEDASHQQGDAGHHHVIVLAQPGLDPAGRRRAQQGAQQGGCVRGAALLGSRRTAREPAQLGLLHRGCAGRRRAGTSWRGHAGDTDSEAKCARQRRWAGVEGAPLAYVSSCAQACADNKQRRSLWAARESSALTHICSNGHRLQHTAPADLPQRDACANEAHSEHHRRTDVHVDHGTHAGGSSRPARTARSWPAQRRCRRRQWVGGAAQPQGTGVRRSTLHGCRER